MTDIVTDNTEAQSTTELMTKTTIVLRKPIKEGNREITEIELDEPTLKQLREASKEATDIDALAKLISLNAKLLPVTVDKLLQREIEAAGRFFAQFALHTD